MRTQGGAVVGSTTFTVLAELLRVARKPIAASIATAATSGGPLTRKVGMVALRHHGVAAAQLCVLVLRRCTSQPRPCLPCSCE